MPAAVLIDRKHECRYFLGPIDRYLRVAVGLPSHNLLSMVRPSLRLKLRSAIERSSQKDARAVVASARISVSGGAVAIRISIQPVLSQGERLLLVCFDESRQGPKRSHPVWRSAGLEHEHEASSMRLRDGIRNLKVLSQGKGPAVITARQTSSVVRRDAESCMEATDARNSRFLTTATHELRQSLQTLALLRWLLAQTVEGGKAKKLVALLGNAVTAMSRTLDTLLDVTSIDDSRGSADKINGPINDMLDRLTNHFTDQAQLQESGPACTGEISLAPGANGARHGRHGSGLDEGVVGFRRTGAILFVEDDARVRDRLEPLLRDEGHHMAIGLSGLAAVELVARESFQPDLILADHNLPDMDGLRIAAMLRKKLRRKIPVIILTGDISTETLHNMLLHDCVQLTKPVKLKELAQVIQGLLPRASRAMHLRARYPVGAADDPELPVIFVVDDDSQLRAQIRGVLEEDGHTVEDYASSEAFLEAYRPTREACLLIDVYLPGMNGLELLRRLHDAGHRLPAIMITGSGDVKVAVQAMKAGASDFIEKPIGGGELLASVRRALEQSRDARALLARRETAASHIACLTPRQREIMELVLAGRPSKVIAADLGISRRTVENHRAAIMKRTGSTSLPALARLAVAVASNGAGTPSVQRIP